MPPAPAMFSITICWPRLSPTRGAISRAATSTGPPAAKGTTRVMGRVGQSCAEAAGIAPASAQATSSAFAAVIVHSLPFFLRHRRGAAARSRAYSIRGRATRLDRWRPFLEFARDELRHVVRVAPFRGGDGQPEVFEARANRRRVDRLARRLREAADDRLRRTFGKEERVPGVDVEAAQALLVGGGKVGQHAAAVGRQDGERLHRLRPEDRKSTR